MYTFPMLQWSRIYKELSIGLEGLKRGIMEIAITTSENTRVAKLLYRIYELERRIEKIYIQAGKFVYENQHLSYKELAGHSEIRYYLNSLKNTRQDISAIEKEITLLREDQLKLRVDELTKYMRRGGYTIDEIKVEQYSKGDSKSIDELDLPSGVRIIAVISNGLFIVPENKTIIREGDRIFILGPVEKIKVAASLFTSSPDFSLTHHP